MISGREIKVLDLNAEFYGVPNKKLMENAGKGISDFIVKSFRSKIKKILMFCGLGNNGGDGFVAARYLSTHFQITVFLTGRKSDIKTDIAKKNYSKLLNNKKIEILNIDSLNKIEDLIEKNDLIIDSMLGVGLSGKLREPYSSVVKNINSARKKTIISVDLPTGLGTNLAVKPNYTITFHDVKFGMNQKNCKKIIKVDIGVPNKAIEYIGPGELKTYYPIPKSDSHKGDNGKLLIIGGGPYYGAPALSSFAAQRTGVDLVYLAAPKKVARAITSYSPLLIKPQRLAKDIAKLSPTLIVRELTNDRKLVPKDIALLDDLMKKADALLIGPGLGLEKDTQKAVVKILNKFCNQKKPIVIDADAIKTVADNLDIIRNSKTILTPHFGEFKELTRLKLSNNLEQQKNKVKSWAKKMGVTILLKGSIDIISDGSDIKLNDIHNKAMTVGGTGDVLAGITGALLAKKIEPFNAARIAAFINGYAGNLAYEKRSYGLIATDLIDEITNVLKKYLR